MKAGWFVDLIGEAFDLQELERLPFPAGTELEILEDERFIRMAVFSPTANASEVLAAAAEAIKVINGAGQLYIANWKNIRGGGPMRVDADGKRHLFAFAEPLVVRTRFGTLTAFINGKPVGTPAPTASELAMTTADVDTAVEKVLRIYGSSDLTFRDLYVIYETVEHDVGGLESLAARGWVAKNDIRRFKHTANSAASLGDQARHGADSTAPPKVPTTLSEARELVARLVKLWIASKP